MPRTLDRQWDEVGAPVAQVGSPGDTHSCQIPPWEESRRELQGLLGSRGWSREVGGEEGVPPAREAKLESGSQTFCATGRTLPRTDVLEGSLEEGAWVFAQQGRATGRRDYPHLIRQPWLSLLGTASGETRTGKAHLWGGKLRPRGMQGSPRGPSSCWLNWEVAPFLAWMGQGSGCPRGGFEEAGGPGLVGVKYHLFHDRVKGHMR